VLNKVEADVIDPPRYHEQGEHGVPVDNKLSGQHTVGSERWLGGLPCSSELRSRRDRSASIPREAQTRCLRRQ
jgi:hypothetical protein